MDILPPRNDFLPNKKIYGNDIPNAITQDSWYTVSNWRDPPPIRDYVICARPLSSFWRAPMESHKKGHFSVRLTAKVDRPSPTLCSAFLWFLSDPSPIIAFSCQSLHHPFTKSVFVLRLVNRTTSHSFTSCCQFQQPCCWHWKKTRAMYIKVFLKRHFERK